MRCSNHSNGQKTVASNDFFKASDCEETNESENAVDNKVTFLQNTSSDFSKNDKNVEVSDRKLFKTTLLSA